MATVQNNQNQGAPDAAVAVGERMDGLELHVSDCGLDYRRQVIAVQKVA
jgi:hypothetical protein